MAIATPVRTKEQRDAGMSIADARNVGTPSSGGSSDPFMSTLQDKLMGQADMISSSSTGVEKGIRDAIAGVNTAKDASAQRIESQYGREFDYGVANAAFKREGVMDSRTGFATNNAFLRNLDLNTEKSLKDLDQRKQELLLAGEAAAAEKISELQLKEIEFSQQAKQQAFANSLAMGNFQLGVQAEKRSADQFKQTFDFNKVAFEYGKQEKIAEIAAQFQIDMSPDDTLDTILTKASKSDYVKLNKQKAMLEIQKLQKDITTIREEETSINLDGVLAEAIAGTGMFEGQGPASPDAAAIYAANYMKQIGITPTRSDINGFRDKAIKMKSDYDTTASQVQAEEQGKGFFSNFSDFFGPSASVRASEALSANYTGADAFKAATGGGSASGDGTDNYSSFFNGLFGQ